MPEARPVPAGRAAAPRSPARRPTRRQHRNRRPVSRPSTTRTMPTSTRPPRRPAAPPDAARASPAKTAEQRQVKCRSGAASPGAASPLTPARTGLGVVLPAAGFRQDAFLLHQPAKAPQRGLQRLVVAHPNLRHGRPLLPVSGRRPRACPPSARRRAGDACTASAPGAGLPAGTPRWRGKPYGCCCCCWGGSPAAGRQTASTRWVPASTTRAATSWPGWGRAGSPGNDRPWCSRSWTRT